MQQEISHYAIAQKDKNGLDKAVEDSKYRMKRYGVTPNLLVIPPQLSLYMALAPEERLTWKDGGPSAVSKFEAGVAGFETGSFRGCGIVTSDPFEVSDDQEAVQMLQRFTQVGEFYVMNAPDMADAPDKKGAADVLLYDEEADRHVRIKWEDACVATGLLKKTAGGELETTNWAKEKKISDLNLDGNADDGLSVGEWCAAAIKVAKGEYAGTGQTCCICLARPFIEHAMLSAILCVSGGDTGATIFGPSDMQISVRAV
jgi:hypothetical protein